MQLDMLGISVKVDRNVSLFYPEFRYLLFNQ